MVTIFFQLQRNILATNPRVTRFKIDWDDTVSEVPAENGENIPPPASLESESNQMGFGQPLEPSKTAHAPGMDVDDSSVSMS